MNETVKKVLRLVVGLGMAAGALAAWKLCDLNPGFAALIGISGLAMAASALDFKLDDWF